AQHGSAQQFASELGLDLVFTAVPDEQRSHVLGVADLEPFPHRDEPLRGAEGRKVGSDEDERGVGQFHGHRGGVVDSGAAVHDHHVVAGSQGAEDLPGGVRGDVFPVFAVDGGEQDVGAVGVHVDGFGEHRGADVVGGVNEVDDAATVFEVVVAGDVAGLEVEVDEADRLAVPGRDPGEVDRCRGGAHPAFGAGQADDPAAPPPDRKV